jgi:hypothetical protein
MNELEGLSQMATNGKDISQMTSQEIVAFLKQREQDEAKAVKENGVKFKSELEAYCLKKYNMSLGAIFHADKKVLEHKIYKNPETGSLYTYKGKGKVPKWLWISDKDHKPNSAHEHRSN